MLLRRKPGPRATPQDFKSYLDSNSAMYPDCIWSW